jgi:hypothetical protein
MEKYFQILLRYYLIICDQHNFNNSKDEEQVQTKIKVLEIILQTNKIHGESF